MRSRPLLLAATVAFAAAPAAFAADHLDSPSVMADGRLDINDLYAFQSADDSDNTVLILTVNPGAGVFSPTDFNSRGVYEINVDNDGDAVPDTTYTILFGRARGTRPQSFLVLKDGRRVARGRTGSTSSVAGGGQVTAGLYEDPFFFDLDGFNRFKDGDGGFDGMDFFAGLNVTAIVLEVPTDELTAEAEGDEPADPNIGVFARTTVRGEQFDRVGRPGITTVLIPDGLKDAYNDAIPRNDPRRFADDIAEMMVELFGVSEDYAETIAGVLTPDILTYDTSKPAMYLNGRALPDDVIDISLDVLSNGMIESDGVDSNDATFPGTFPYLAPPHEGEED